MENKKTKTASKDEKKVNKGENPVLTTALLPPRMMAALADQVAKTVTERLRLMLPKKKQSARFKRKEQALDKALFLDTSAIIDGRILEVARLGFLTGTVVIPEFILSELKHIADSEESLRRSKGRRGLDVLSDIKKVKGIKSRIITGDELPDAGKQDIDDRLLTLCKLYKGRLVTSDFNLNKKAKILGVTVLNINELANALKTVALPGEEMKVIVIALGKGKGQGVAYLSDGTMIVVEEGANLIGKAVEVVVSRSIQTAAGRMLFTKLKEY